MPPVDRRSLSARPKPIHEHPGRVDKYVSAWFSNTPKVDRYFARLERKPSSPLKTGKRGGFTLEEYFARFAETLDGSGEFTAARFNDWLIDHASHMARSVRGIGCFLWQKRKSLGVEIRYRDPNHEIPMVWGLKEDGVPNAELSGPP